MPPEASGAHSGSECCAQFGRFRRPIDFRPPYQSLQAKQNHVMELEIKLLSSKDTDDFMDLIKVFGIVFEMDALKIPDNKHLKSLLEKSDFLAFVAKYNNKVIGGLTVYVLHRYVSTQPIAYIYDVGVMPNYQRNGIGKKLIAYLSQYCREKGIQEAYVEAETDDIQAVNFYRTTPISSELQAIHFTYTFDNEIKTCDD